MKEDASKLNADAIINVRITTSMIMQGVAEILAYGTAVKLKNDFYNSFIDNTLGIAIYKRIKAKSKEEFERDY